MFLSRFEINTDRRAARTLLASPQSMHAAVLGGFAPGAASPEALAGREGRVLWRLDRHGKRCVLYLVSPDRPDLTHLVESVGWPTTQGWQTHDYTQLLDKLVPGDRWGFRLAANPVHTSRAADGGRGRRLGHVTVAQQTEWFHKQAKRNGFTVPLGVLKEPDMAIQRREIVTFTRQSKRVTLSTAVFEGQLEVTDPDTLRGALTGGIGPGKGYGCGLLTLASLRPS